MNLRFEVDQAEAFRRGVDCPKSVVSIDVDPAKVDSTVRELIAKRMSGIDVLRLEWEGGTVTHKDGKRVRSLADGEKLRPRFKSFGGQYLRVVAPVPTLEALVEAVKADEAKLSEERGSVMR